MAWFQYPWPDAGFGSALAQFQAHEPPIRPGRGVPIHKPPRGAPETRCCLEKWLWPVVLAASWRLTSEILSDNGKLYG